MEIAEESAIKLHFAKTAAWIVPVNARGAAFELDASEIFVDVLPHLHSK
jgi:hypothetical protein